METDNVEEVSETNNPTLNNEIQRNRLIYSTFDSENGSNLTNDNHTDQPIQSCKDDAYVNGNDDDNGEDAQDNVDEARAENSVMELTQYNEDGASFSTLDVSNLDRSELDLSVRRDLNFVFDDTVEGEEDQRGERENIRSNSGSDGARPAKALSSPVDEGGNEEATGPREDSSRPKPHLTKPFEDVSPSTATPPAVRCGGSKDVAISDAEDDDGGVHDNDVHDDDDLGAVDDDNDDQDETDISIGSNREALHNLAQSAATPDISTSVPPDSSLAAPSNEQMNLSLEAASRSVRDANPEAANLSFLHLDDTFNDTSTVFQSDNGEISFILQDGSFLAADGLVFGEVGEEDEANNGSPNQAVVGAVSIDQRVELVETADLPTMRRLGKVNPNVVSEDVANEESADGRQEAADNLPADGQIQQGNLPEGFDVNGGELVYLQDGDGEGRLIQLPSNAVFQSEDGTVTMILPDTSEAIPNEGELVDGRPAPDLFRPEQPAPSDRPDTPVTPSDSYSVGGVSSEHNSHHPHPLPPHPSQQHSRPEGVVGLDQDVLAEDDVDSPLFRQRAAATVDVVAEDIVNVAPPPLPPKKKKKKSGSSKMVEGVVEYDLAGFPEDGVLPIEPTHPMSFVGVGVGTIPAQIPATRTSGPEVMSGIPAGDGDAGSRGGRNGAFPCATPGMIQDPDTVRALCYDYIDHLITTNRGKIAIPRTHEFGDIGGWGFLHFNPSIPPSFEEYQRHVSPLPKREDFPSKGFTRFLSCRGFLLPKDWERLLPENPEARELYNLGAMQIYARRLCPDALFDPRDDPSHTPEMGVNDAYYSFLASTQQRRPPSDAPLLAITDSKHQVEDDEYSSLGLGHIPSLPSKVGTQRKKQTKQHPLAGNALRNLYQDANFSESPLLALPPPPSSEAAFIVDEANVSFRGRDFEICDGQSVTLFDHGDTGSGKQRALDSVPFRHSASFIVPQSNAVAVQKLGKSNVPLIPSIVRNLDRIICRVKGQRKEHQSTRRKGGEFGFLALGLIRDPPDDSEKIITHRTVYEAKENLARTACVEKSPETKKKSSSPTQIKVEAEEVVESDVGKRRENDEGGHGDYETPPRRKPMIASPSPPKSKRDALRKELRVQDKTPPIDPYRIEKPSNPPPRPSKPDLKSRGSRHSMRLRRPQAKKRRGVEYEHEEEEEEDDKETVKRGLRKRAKSYSHYEIFGSEEDDDDDDEDDADDEDASDDCGRKGVKTRGAKRSGSDESDILRKTRRARRRIIDDAMSEDSGVSDDNAALNNNNNNAALNSNKDVEAGNLSSDAVNVIRTDNGRDHSISNAADAVADDEDDASIFDGASTVDAASTVGDATDAAAEAPIVDVADAVMDAAIDAAIEAVATRSSEDISAARKFSKKLSAVVTRDMEDDLRRESQRETSEANGGIGTPDGERKAPALSIDSAVASDGSAGIDVATADAAVSSNTNAVTDFAHIATTSSGSPRSDPALRVGSFAPVGSEPVASKPVSSEPATEECFLPPNDEDTDVDESRQTTFKSNEGENYPSMNTGDENAKAHRVPSFKVNKNQDDNVKGQLGRTTSENASDIEDHLDSSIDLFESPHPLRARMAMMIGKADEKRNDTRPSSSQVDGTRKEDTTPATTQPADITPSNCLSLSPSSDASSRNLRNAASEEEATRDDASVPLDVSTDCVDQQQQHDAEEIAQTQTQTKRPRGRPRKNPKTESQSQSQRSLRSNSNSTEGVRTRSQEKESIPHKKQKTHSTAGKTKRRTHKRK